MAKAKELVKDTMLWTAATVPLQLLNGLPAHLQNLMARLDGLLVPPNAFTEVPVDETRWGGYTKALSGAMDCASNSVNGFQAAIDVKGPSDVHSYVCEARNFAQTMVACLRTVQSTIPRSTIGANGLPASENAAAVILNASKMVLKAVGETQAYLAVARGNGEKPVTNKTY